MPLEVDITKKFAGFELRVSFATDDSPISVLGPSGAGKTMLLRCIAGLDRPDSGRIVLNNRILFDAKKQTNLPSRERRVGLLFQQYALFPHRTVEENIAFPLEGFSESDRSKRVASLIERTQISGLERRYPRQLSGGEQQRAALARALALDPEALLLDEPLSALDTHLRSKIEHLLEETFAGYPRPSLLVTHNVEEAYRLGTRLLVLSHGQIVAFGEKEAIFQKPPTMEVALLTGCKNISRAKSSADGLVEAIDWGCNLKVRGTAPSADLHVGIRAHHIEFAEAERCQDINENVFPCWLAQISETPFRVTAYLSLQRPPQSATDYHLQVELFKEKWSQLRDRPFPWHVRLAPEHLFLMPK
jgi:molybdate transport system permease protein